MRGAYRAPSLRARLLLVVLGLVSIGWVVVLGLTWLDLRHELDELLDAHLAQTAAMLSGLHLDDLRTLDATEAPLLHEYQQEVAIQVWHEGILVARSANAPVEALAPLPSQGLSVQQIGRDVWRVLSTPGLESDVHIFVGEREGARKHVMYSSMERAIWPILAGFPLIVAGLVWAVRAAVRPLRRLGEQVARRQPQALDALDASGAPREVQPLVDALNRLFERMAERLAAEQRFTADAAHELRTPLAALRMQVQVAQGATDESERARALADTLVACDRAAHLVDQLLQLARLEADAASAGCLDGVKAEERARGTEWPTLARELADTLAPQLAAQAQRLEVYVAGTPPASDIPVALARVLLRNLLDNASRYSPDGAQVQLQIAADPTGAARITIEDSGPGLSPEDLARLGERFFRVLGTGRSGSGLGWSIVRRIARLYRIDIDLGRSAALGGLRVELTVPPARSGRKPQGQSPGI